MIDSADKWMDYRNLRNILTHEYPDNRDELIQGLTRFSLRMTRLSRRVLGLQGIFWTSGITPCIAEFRKISVDSQGVSENPTLL